MTNEMPPTLEAGGWELQSHLLLGVSRTFAFTIPQLPKALQNPVGNGYLLCRIVDTIEDDPGLSLGERSYFFDEFLSALNGTGDAQEFAKQLHQALSNRVLPEERALIRATPQVLELTRRLSSDQQSALTRCVTIMSRGMYEFQSRKSLDGLKDVEELSRYCYAVAGVVGEMLTDLFCDYSPAIRERRDEMMALSICFGQGLQLTNILKDVWEDQQDGSCWLPRSVFSGEGAVLKDLMHKRQSENMTDGISYLVGIARDNLNTALAYTTLIPKEEVGIRRFCLWAIGMAVTTLQKIQSNPGYHSGEQVKISRTQVFTIIKTLNLALHSDWLINAWFKFPAMGLPRSTDFVACDPGALRKIVSGDSLGTDSGSAR